MANNFKLTLDTLAPSGGFINIDKLPRYAKEAFTLEINKGDATHMAVWADTQSAEMIQDLDLNNGYFALNWIEAAGSYEINGADLAMEMHHEFYCHLVLKDDVNNKSEIYTVGPFMYDNEAPAISSDEWRSSLTIYDSDDNCYTNQIANLNIKFTAEDSMGSANSGIAKAIIWGTDVTEYEVTFDGDTYVDYEGTFSFNAGVEDGEKVVYVKLIDRAGNESVAVASNTLILDRVIADPVLVLYESTSDGMMSDRIISNSYTPFTKVFYQIYLGGDSTDAYSDNIAAFKIWEMGVGSEETAEWITTGDSSYDKHQYYFHEASDGTWLNVEGYSIEVSAGDGPKVLYAKIKDAAGNESEAVYNTVYVDQTAPSISSIEVTPEVVSHNEDYNYITITVKGFEEDGSKIQFFSVQRQECDKTSDPTDPNSWSYSQNTYCFSYHGDASRPEDTFELQVEGNWDEEHNLVFNDYLPAEYKEEGAEKYYRYFVSMTDWVGNSYEGEQLGVFSNIIDMDDRAPEITIATLNSWYNETFPVTVTVEDWHEIKFIKAYVGYSECAWIEASELERSGNTFVIPASAIDFTSLYESAENYLTVEAMDIVGNESSAFTTFGYDATAPQIISASFSKAVYNGANAAINLMIKDYIFGSETEEGSNGIKVQFTGDILESSEETWLNYASSFNVTLTSGDGVKSVLVKAKDATGNVCAGVLIKCELDTVKPVIGMTLYEVEYEGEDLVLNTVKTGETALRTFVAQIDASDYCSYNPETDSVELCKLYYKIYGDIVTETNTTGTVGEASVAWTEFVPVAGQTYMLVSGACTGGDSQKSIYLAVMDTAGNISYLEAPCTFTLDETLPSVTISNVDHNRISTVHEAREICLDTTGTHSKVDENLSFADEVKFTITPDSVIQAWKVCAYLDEADAENGTAEDAPILSEEDAQYRPEPERSINMAGSGIRSDAAIDCVIKGEDFECALLARAGKSNHGEVDGIHYVVVYVQDLAGLWSVAGKMAV